MKWRDRLAGRVGGGRLLRAGRGDLFCDPDREFRFGVALCAIRDMETEESDQTAKLMGQAAREALK